MPDHDLKNLPPTDTSPGPAIVVHIPHSRIEVPDRERRGYLLPEADLHTEIVRLTDWYTDELFELPASVADSVAFPYSRFFVDVERFRDDAEEPMAARGMGAVYASTTQGTPLRRPITAPERERLLTTYYDTHHAALTEAVNSALQWHGRCLIIDAHSFPSRPLPCDRDQSEPRPDFCVGTDPFHTPPELVDAAVASLGNRGWTVTVDAPYAGTIVPLDYYRRDARVQSIMIEVNRRLYLDESSGAKSIGYPAFQSVFGACLRSIVHDWSS